MQEEALSMEQLEIVLDNAPVAVYVTAVETMELLYVNHLARKILSWNLADGRSACYQAAGYSAPCPFCQVDRMSRDKLLVREFEHPGSGRVFQLSGKIIDWAGESAHIEYIVDITERKRSEAQTEALQHELEATFSSIPCGLSVYRFDGEKISPLFHNAAFYEIMGYSGEHVQSVEETTSFLGVHPEDLDPLRDKITQAVLHDGVVRHAYRVWNDRRGEYRWIYLEGSRRTLENGTTTLYGVYSDVTGQKRLENELKSANEKMQDIINAIPGGVAVYKVSDVFETVYFSDGVPALSGYTVEEYRALAQCDAAMLTYPEDTEMVVGAARRAIREHTAADLDFRKLHRDGHVVWVHVQARQIGEEDGLPLLQCVFHNISALKEAQVELDHLVNSIPGGIASYRVEGDRFIPTFYSDGLLALSGHTREDLDRMAQFDAFDIIYEPDRERVFAAAQSALLSGEVLDVSYRMRHKNGSLVWIHLNGRRMGPLSDVMGFYAVFTGMSAEARLFQSIANETADGIYVIGRDNDELFYANEAKDILLCGQSGVGQKCYAALQGRDTPCEHCALREYAPDGEEHEMALDGSDRFYTTRFRETDWNGIPAYVKYVRDITEEVRTRRENERLSMYFQTVVENLPGGIAVIRGEPDGRMILEYMSDGFAAMTHMTLEEAGELYAQDVFAGVHPDDIASNREILRECMERGEGHGELTARMRRGDGGYVWVKDMLSVRKTTDGVRRIYSIYTDITGAVEEKEKLRRQYEEILLQHYRTPGPDELILGHCNITKNKILEIIDHTDSDLLETFGTVREEFFLGLSGLVADEAGRETFRGIYLNAPSLAAFRRGETERVLLCFIRLPREERGRHVRFKVNMVETPDTGDVTGILTVTDVTEQTISERIMHQLSMTGCDYIADLDLGRDSYRVLACNKGACCAPLAVGRHSDRMKEMLRSVIVPKDRGQYARALEPDEIRRRLARENSYTFSYSLTDRAGDIRTKNVTVSAVDLRLDRVCLVCTDITDSVREQQGLLNMIAYTFDLAGFIHVGSGRLTMYTRQTVLENLTPYLVEDYDCAISRFAGCYGEPEDRAQVQEQLRLDTMLRRLGEKPSGYDFVFPYHAEETLRYKQVNVLWGDQNRSTVCLVRADVTDMLAAERQTKRELEKALALAERANRAKSDFLSAMSHDIRTPMNAIMGMTALAVAHLEERERVADCLQKIGSASRHLLSLINDILDMSKIERNRITLNRVKISLSALVGQLSAMMVPQARDAGLQIAFSTQGVAHGSFYGDELRVSQILINLLGNAVKFTPRGGRVDFLAEEVGISGNPPRVRYRFTVADTGIGMQEEFLEHLFDPFTRSRGVETIQGTGLGLSITKGLVDLMGGEIAVESRAERGSTFRVELEGEIAPDGEVPVASPADADPAGADERPFEGRRFLAAEDNAINAEILSELLALYGAEAVVKEDGAQAVQAFREAAPGTFDAILMDIQMPVMNGYDAARAIRALDRADAARIPIVAMTANAFQEDVDACLSVGMTAHVAKPIDVEVLRAALSKALNR